MVCNNCEGINKDGTGLCSVCQGRYVAPVLRNYNGKLMCVKCYDNELKVEQPKRELENEIMEICKKVRSSDDITFDETKKEVHDAIEKHWVKK